MQYQIDSAAILVRILVGWVFLLEGVLKFAWWNELGVGRFAAIGIPAPAAMAPFVGALEIICGLLILIGLFTRLATVPLLIDISVAILSTKVPILLGHSYWRFAPPKLNHYGLLSMLHEARTDISMVFGLVFLLMIGGGRWSVDAARRHWSNRT